MSTQPSIHAGSVNGVPVAGVKAERIHCFTVWSHTAGDAP